jgi:hypothetical protein
MQSTARSSRNEREMKAPLSTIQHLGGTRFRCLPSDRGDAERVVSVRYDVSVRDDPSTASASEF